MKTPRARTLEHMRGLVSLAAFTACSSGTSTPPDIGYQVVDPMPAPARCADTPPGVTATAALAADGADGIEVTVTITAPDGSTLSDAVTASEPATLLDKKAVAGGFELRVSGPKTGSLSVTLSLTCAKGTDTVYVGVSPPAAGAAVGARLETSVSQY